MLNKADQLKSYHAIAKSMSDECYNSLLRSNPHAALKAVGLTIDHQIEIIIHDEKYNAIENDNELHLVIPKLNNIAFTDMEFGRMQISNANQASGEGFNSDCFNCNCSAMC